MTVSEDSSPPTPYEMPERATLNLPEVAALLGVSRTSIYRWAEQGLVPTIRLGRRLLVPRAAVEELLFTPSVAQNFEPPRSSSLPA